MWPFKSTIAERTLDYPGFWKSFRDDVMQQPTPQDRRLLMLMRAQTRFIGTPYKPRGGLDAHIDDWTALWDACESEEP